MKTGRALQVTYPAVGRCIRILRSNGQLSRAITISSPAQTDCKQDSGTKTQRYRQSNLNVNFASEEAKSWISYKFNLKMNNCIHYLSGKYN